MKGVPANADLHELFDVPDKEIFCAEARGVAGGCLLFFFVRLGFTVDEELQELDRVERDLAAVLLRLVGASPVLPGATACQ